MMMDKEEADMHEEIAKLMFRNYQPSAPRGKMSEFKTNPFYSPWFSKVPQQIRDEVFGTIQ